MNINDLPDEEKLNSHLLTALYRQDCPDTMVLGEYHLGELDKMQQADVAAHLTRCPHCQAELSLLVEFLGNEPLAAPNPGSSLASPPAPAPNWYEVALDQGRAWLEQETDRWRRLWLLLPTLEKSFPGAPALAGLMSEGGLSASSVLGRADFTPAGANFALHLIVVQDPNDPNRCSLQADVILTDRFGDFSGVQVTLWAGDAAQVQVTNTQGEVLFTGLLADQLSSMRLLVTLPH
ncbi:MAG: hypothetical protein KDI79_25095 [Anaerolineae bacterium]|nr:hypothetical protein [Anaerolineae bacterium]